MFKTELNKLQVEVFYFKQNTLGFRKENCRGSQGF